MVATVLKLSEQSKQKLEELSRRTGRTLDDLANEAIDRLAEAEKPVADWKAALMQAAGMWKDRDDIPELMTQLKREWNRIEPPEDAQ